MTAAARHRIVPEVVASGIVLDMRVPHLGHPDKPWLWDSLHGKCAVGTLRCQCCGHPVYLQERAKNRKRVVCTYTEAEIRAALGESDIHKAFKDAIATEAERRGLTAIQESAGAGRKRVTDVIVQGGNKPIGWEVQCSPISMTSLKRRMTRAEDDDLVPSWLTYANSPSRTTLYMRSPLSVATADDPTALDVRAHPDMRVRTTKGIDVVRCTHKGAPWHKGVKCSGWHCQPSTQDHAVSTLGAMVEDSAAGRVIALKWPRSSRQYRNGFWLWVTAADAERFREIELGLNRKPAPAPVEELNRPWIGRDGWHAIPIPEPQRFTNPGQCPDCGHYGGRHRQGVGVYITPCPQFALRACPDCRTPFSLVPRSHLGECQACATFRTHTRSSR